MENWHIRLAKHGEEENICSLLYESFVAYKWLYTEKAFESTTLAVNKILDRIGKKMIWVGLHHDIISGTVSLQPLHRTMYIRSLAVFPGARRRGLAKELMRHAERQAVKNNLFLLELTTTPFLVEAIALYKAWGFEACGHEDLFGTRLIRMKKILNPAVIPNGKIDAIND